MLPEGVKKFHRVGGPGLQRVGKAFGNFVGRVPSRGVFESLHTFPLIEGIGFHLVIGQPRPAGDPLPGGYLAGNAELLLELLDAVTLQPQLPGESPQGLG